MIFMCVFMFMLSLSSLSNVMLLVLCQVCVIAVVLRTEAVAYRCLLQCQNQLHNSEGVSNIHSDHFDFPYGTADIMCPVPSGCKSPSRISVISAAAKSEGTEEVCLFLDVLPNSHVVHYFAPDRNVWLDQLTWDFVYLSVPRLFCWLFILFRKYIILTR